MIIRKKECVRQEIEDMCGGKGTTLIEHIVGKEELRDNGHLYARVILHPGDSIGTHSHFNECEFYYILKGEAACQDNGKGVVLRPGDVMITRDGGNHSIMNVGRSDLEFIALITNEQA